MELGQEFNVINEEELALKEWCSQTKQTIWLDKSWLASNPDFDNPDNQDELWDTFASYERILWNMKEQKDNGTIFTADEQLIYKSIAQDLLLPILNYLDSSFSKEHSSTVSLVKEISDSQQI